MSERGAGERSWRAAVTVWLVLEAVGLLALCCRSDPAPGSVPAPVRTAGGEAQRAQLAAEPSALAAGDAGAAAAADGIATDTSADTAPPAPASNPVSRMLRLTDDADRTLLSELERQTGGSPPPAAQQLLALRRSGAARSELERFIHAQLAAPLPARMAALRWLNEVAPLPGATGRKPDPVPSAFGKGGQPRRVQGVQPAGR